MSNPNYIIINNMISIISFCSVELIVKRSVLEVLLLHSG